MSSERPLVIPLIALSTGCLLEYLLAVPVSVVIPVITAAALVVVLPFGSRRLFGCLMALFWASWAMAALAPRLDTTSTCGAIAVFDGQQVLVEGLLLRRPVNLSEGQRLEVQVERVFRNDKVFLAGGTLQVTIGHGQTDLMSGDRVRFPAKLKVPRLLGLPGEFDVPRYLRLRGIAATAWVKDADTVVLMRGAASRSLLRWIDRCSLQSQRFIRQTLTNPDQHGVVLALATGGQHEVSPALTNAYSRAGVSHILSVSGFHVGVVTLVWVFLLRWLLLRWEWLALRIDLRRGVLLSAVPLMVVYLIFTGGAPATARSVLMLSAIVLAIWSEREVDILDALLLAAFLLLLYDPALLFDLSFQLSFLALWGLVVVTPLIAAPFERYLKYSWQRTLLLFCAASLAAVLATLVPVLATFHQASCTGIIANLVVVPLLGYGATVLATAAIPMIFLMPILATFLLQVAGWLVQASNLFVIWIAETPVLQSYSIGPHHLLVMVTVIALFSFIRSLRIRMLISILVLAVLTLQYFSPGQLVNGALNMTFMSVGQGDALLIVLPDGRTMLVDGGGYLQENGKDFGERYLVPALHCLKIRRIDIMVLTHPHPDHLGGLPAVAEQFQVGEFWQSVFSGQGEGYQRLLRALHRQKTLQRILKRGDHPLTAGNLEVTVESPLVHQQTAGENDDSLVVRLQHGRFSALLMGDAGFAVEHQLIRQDIGETTLLKVGHHGSKSASSEQFLQFIKPKVAVISVGAGNHFGLPAAETVARFRQRGIAVYRTDQDGTILVSSGEHGFTICPLATENRLVAAVRRFILTGSELLR